MVTKNWTGAKILRTALRGNGSFLIILGGMTILESRSLGYLLDRDAPALFVSVGVGLLVFGFSHLLISAQEPFSRRWAITFVILNSGLVVGSALLVFADWTPLTSFGKQAIALIGGIIAIGVIVQGYGLRKMA